MNSSLPAAVLCIAMQAAVAAPCVAPVPVAQHTRPSAVAAKKKPVAAAPAAAAAHGGELIKTASAGTHDELPRLARGAPVAVAAAEQDDESHRRGGPAMLLAALALMSGIALRRFGSNRQ